MGVIFTYAFGLKAEFWLWLAKVPSLLNAMTRNLGQDSAATTFVLLLGILLFDPDSASDCNEECDSKIFCSGCLVYFGYL